MSIADGDTESEARIDMHRARRPQAWTTIEEARDLNQAIMRSRYSMDICLLDCLSLWLSNILPHIDDAHPTIDPSGVQATIQSVVSEQVKVLLQAIDQCRETQFIVVTNEVGSGIVPDNFLARVYRDALGALNQQVAQQAKEVWLCCVGLQLKLK